jgi:hypothetical protein
MISGSPPIDSQGRLPPRRPAIPRRPMHGDEESSPDHDCPLLESNPFTVPVQRRPPPCHILRLISVEPRRPWWRPGPIAKSPPVRACSSPVCHGFSPRPYTARWRDTGRMPARRMKRTSMSNPPWTQAPDSTLPDP